LKMIIIYAVLCVSLFTCIGYSAGYYFGQKSRSVIIKYNDVSRKLPDMLEQAEITVTPEQLSKLNHVFIKEKEKIGFK